MSFRPDDILEATQDVLTDDGPISEGMRLIVREVCPTGAVFRAFHYDSFVPAEAFKRIGRLLSVQVGERRTIQAVAA